MNEVNINKVFKRTSFENEGAEELIRIVWIDKQNLIAQYVSLSIKVAMPHPIKVVELCTAIENGFMAEASDPFAHVIAEEQIPHSYKAMRDRKWLVVSYVWAKNTDKVLFKAERPKLFDEAAQLFDLHPMEVRRTMSRFWQRGMTPNALLPDFDKRGMKGMPKADTGNKRGRPREYFGAEEEMPGINVTDDVKKKIREAIDLFYLSKNKATIKDTYNQMLARDFSDVIYQGGQKRYNVWTPDRIPTYQQFYYWFKQFTDKKTNVICRDGDREFALKYRELLGDTSAEAFGPGFKYQVDATIADVYLVSMVNSEYIIGRPVVYVIMDVFSRLIVGIYVGIEGPSWLGAMMAFDNVVADKVEFCRQYGIDITVDKWPSSLLPERLLADRGEFEGKCPQAMISNLGISIENTAPYRGDLKGIVERHFRTTNERIKTRLPGAVRKAVKTRGETDYRLDARLNLEEFTKIMIFEVINHNNSVMEQYSKSEFEISDSVKPVPVEIWRWGAINRRCGFIARDREFVRLCLMPRATATITREGIRFHSVYYSCDTAIREGWFIKPQRASIQIAYDPRTLANIYIPDSTGKIFIKCLPVANSKQFSSLSYDDYLMLQQYLEEEKVFLRAAKTQLSINTDEEIRKIVNHAKNKQKTDDIIELSKSEKLRNIRDNRKTERDELRQKEIFELDKKTNPVIKKADIIDIRVDKERRHQSDYEDEILELLKHERDERLGRKK